MSETTLMDAAVDAYRRSLVEGCCAGAVVETLPQKQVHVPGRGGRPGSWSWIRLDPCSIAQTIEPLAMEVAEELLQQPTSTRVMGLCLPDGLPPFAASYYDAGGVRTYVLASGECGECEGRGHHRAIRDDGSLYRCEGCSGTGARTDVGEIARRYGGDGDARRASFTVKV